MGTVLKNAEAGLAKSGDTSLQVLADGTFVRNLEKPEGIVGSYLPVFVEPKKPSKPAGKGGKSAATATAG